MLIYICDDQQEEATALQLCLTKAAAELSADCTILLLQLKIGKKSVVKEIGHGSRAMLQFSHERLDFVGNILNGVGNISGVYRKLQGMIQIFVRVVFRRIRRQEKHFNLLLVLFKPGGSKLTMMDLQVIQNQEDLLFRRTNQPLHKSNQSLLVHGILIDHKADLALAADG